MSIMGWAGFLGPQSGLLPARLEKLSGNVVITTAKKVINSGKDSSATLVMFWPPIFGPF